MKKMLLISASIAMLLFTGCEKTQVKNEIDAKKYDQLQFLASSTAAGKYELESKTGFKNVELTLNTLDLSELKKLIKTYMADNLITSEEYDKIISKAYDLSKKNEIKERDENKAILRQVLK